MKKLPFSELLQAEIHLSSISSVERWWQRGNINAYPNGREENILSFTIHGKKEIYPGEAADPVISASAPIAVFIAANAPYCSKTVLDDETDLGHTICIKFSLTDQYGEAISIEEQFLSWDLAKNESVQKLFYKIYRLYLNAQVNRLQLKSLTFGLLSELCLLLAENRKMQNEFADLQPALDYINLHYGENIGLEEMSKICYMSTSHFRRRFKEYTGGDSFSEYRTKVRLKKAEELLENQIWTVDVIAEVCGFYDASHFYRVYKKYTGITPKEHNK